MRFRTLSDPHWTGRWMESQTDGVSAMTSTNSSERSRGWEVMKRTLWMPGTSPTCFNNWAKVRDFPLDFRSQSIGIHVLAQEHDFLDAGLRQFLGFRQNDSQGRDTSRPRVKGTTQKVQNLSQPFMISIKALWGWERRVEVILGKINGIKIGQDLALARSRASRMVWGTFRYWSGPTTMSI